ncbi:hypothetical protein PIB30_017872 [Stylosanthes scabra]|uniref:Terpene synthase N-terminal domain-containing protein n=1 Tax=Stylosanthes scabra TaxID=79078 RepID=A0ABU6X598_9FABA|nr:hypothetical protein [Stylosanthes scabra]
MVMRTFLAAPKYSNNNETITENCRRSASYLPNRWNFEFLSKEIDPKAEAEERVEERAKELEKEVRCMVMKGGEDMEGVVLLELIDNVQRLGLAYKFDAQIKATLHNLFLKSDFENNNNKNGLHATALAFRLLRQHGFPVSQGNNNTCIFSS